MKIYESVDEVVGHTPLVKLNKIMAKEESLGNLFAKVEYFNPTGSVKDRIANAMIEDAEEKGLIKPGYSTLIEPTSGNTGIGLASMGTAKGYKVIIVMPDTMSIERRKLMAFYGAEIVLTPGKEGMKGAMAKADELAKNTVGGIVLGQFVNPANPKVHYKTTGPEIYHDLDGKVDVIVAGVGTGGTLSGIAKFLKEKNPEVRVIAVEPDTSAVLSGEKPGPHKIQGIGAGFIPKTMDTALVDEIIKVSGDQAFSTSKLLGRTEGLSTGISSGAALFAGIAVSKREEMKGKNIVVILPDSGDRYLSTPLFD